MTRRLLLAWFVLVAAGVRRVHARPDLQPASVVEPWIGGNPY